MLTNLIQTMNELDQSNISHGVSQFLYFPSYSTSPFLSFHTSKSTLIKISLAVEGTSNTNAYVNTSKFDFK